MHIEFPGGPEYDPVTPAPEETPEDAEKERALMELAKKKVLDVLLKNGAITEEELVELCEEHAAVHIRKAIQRLEEESKIRRETGPDGTEYLVPVETMGVL